MTPFAQAVLKANSSNFSLISAQNLSYTAAFTNFDLEPAEVKRRKAYASRRSWVALMFAVLLGALVGALDPFGAHMLSPGTGGVILSGAVGTIVFAVGLIGVLIYHNILRPSPSGLWHFRLGYEPPDLVAGVPGLHEKVEALREQFPDVKVWFVGFRRKQGLLRRPAAGLAYARASCGWEEGMLYVHPRVLEEFELKP